MTCPGLREPFFELGRMTGYFSSPFDYLQSVLPGFAPHKRFLLNRCLQESSEAIAARDADIALERQFQLGVAAPKDAERLLHEFYRRHHEEIQGLTKQHYPWLYHDPLDATPEQYEPDTRVNDYIDDVVFRKLELLGLDRKHRKAKRTSWTATTDLFPKKVSLHFDKGSQTSIRMSGYLRIEGIPFAIDVAEPFFFSQSDFRYSVIGHVDRQLELFFHELGRLLPHVIEAFDNATQHLERCALHG